MELIGFSGDPTVGYLLFGTFSALKLLHMPVVKVKVVVHEELGSPPDLFSVRSNADCWEIAI
jgi:hypothetical protein